MGNFFTNIVLQTNIVDNLFSNVYTLSVIQLCNLVLVADLFHDVYNGTGIDVFVPATDVAAGFQYAADGGAVNEGVIGSDGMIKDLATIRYEQSRNVFLENRRLLHEQLDSSYISQDPNVRQSILKRAKVTTSSTPYIEIKSEYVTLFCFSGLVVGLGVLSLLWS